MPGNDGRAFVVERQQERMEITLYGEIVERRPEDWTGKAEEGSGNAFRLLTRSRSSARPKSYRKRSTAKKPVPLRKCFSARRKGKRNRDRNFSLT